MDLTTVLSLGQTALELGLICSLTVLALFLSYSMLNVCDLSTDGCFTLGATVGAVVAIAGHPLLALPAAMLAAQALVADGVDAVFTPTDNTIMTAELSIYETFIDAGIPHYTGADSFALNGAFLGYGVDYANLGVETANMVAKILLDGADPASTAVMTFDNGTATVNTETCQALGLNYDEIEAAFAPLCTKVQSITTAESFGDLPNG